ncbi:MaoC family dehydratase [Diplocloster agilis]|uniref:MaoC family dehydratase N-terminal domain-containing protein n=1 Tax=Diplocloster agilis TaxID=2850323 RepID=A0A949NAZ7_9FIRM|nr:MULTISPECIES: MaoC family dehydratase N-terminal domain-containing protein [Lachnospiraceae]MBU9737027.1 MaoC family dehydratase N-terminal domain-containing protein [Diplocloster agilis]MCU6732534.1 MaoC family dehydratase N-terminal domain-containing protein [Suonthocola fibrivorans]SCI50047.1 bifunctional enoyl-CoA hydratase/phosphate acetyltransferase [uncultured Clostridium sp.]
MNEFEEMFKDTWFFEDVPLGYSTASPYGRTIREADIINYAGISGEYAPIYIDDEYAKQTRYGRVVAQDMMLFTFTTSIDTNNELTAKINKAILVSKGTKNWKIYGKAYVGDTIYTKSEIVDKIDNKPTRGVIVTQMSILNQKGEVLQSGEYHLIVAKKCYFEEQFAKQA